MDTSVKDIHFASGREMASVPVVYHSYLWYLCGRWGCLRETNVPITPHLLKESWRPCHMSSFWGSTDKIVTCSISEEFMTWLVNHASGIWESPDTSHSYSFWGSSVTSHSHSSWGDADRAFTTPDSKGNLTQHFMSPASEGVLTEKKDCQKTATLFPNVCS